MSSSIQVNLKELYLFEKVVKKEFVRDRSHRSS